MKNIVKNSLAGFMGFLMLGMIAVEADAASRSSSSRSSVSSSRSSYSAPKAPAPARSMSSNPGLKSLGFGKPASAQTAQRPNVVASPSKTTTTSGGWFGKKSVSSTPAYKPVVRKVSSPVAYRPQSVTVVQKNYYGNRSYGGGYGYNRGYNNYNYGGYNGGNSMGSSMLGGALGAFGGMMVYNALTSNHSYNTQAAQIEQAKQDQRIEDKLDRVIDGQNADQQAVAARPQCFMPEDAPLMMNPQFYCGGSNAK